MSGGSEMELNDGALEFMKKFVSGHRIVATGELTGLQIAEARSDGRFMLNLMAVLAGLLCLGTYQLSKIKRVNQT